MPTPLKIVAEVSVPYLKGVLERLGTACYLPSQDFTPDLIRDADWLIVRSITKCTEALLKGSKVRLITTATIGYDHIDTDYCDAMGIAWHNAPGCNAEAVGQYFASAISRLVIDTGFDPNGKVLGIVGVGHVGKVVKRYAEAFGMLCLLNDPPRAEVEGADGFVSLRQIAEESDIITLHTPLTKVGKHPTYHLINGEFVDTLQHSPIIINACRGAVTDTEALLSGLKRGKISNVIIDCWEGEPDISTALLDKSFIGTPHIAGFSADGKARGARMCIEKGLSFFGINEPELLTKMYPPALVNAKIDLSQLGDQGIFKALLHTFDPRPTDEHLRNGGLRDFEKMRREYDYPREPHAYDFINPTDKQAHFLRQISCPSS